MAEPISAANDSEEVQQATNAEDRKAAAALDALNANAMSQENGETQGTKQPTAADQEALMQAMGRLEAVAGGNAKSVTKKTDEKKEQAKREAEVKKKIKVAPEDVQFLVNELDVNKTKATELLRSHEGKLDATIRAFVTSA